MLNRLLLNKDTGSYLENSFFCSKNTWILRRSRATDLRKDPRIEPAAGGTYTDPLRGVLLINRVKGFELPKPSGTPVA